MNRVDAAGRVVLSDTTPAPSQFFSSHTKVPAMQLWSFGTLISYILVLTHAVLQPSADAGETVKFSRADSLLGITIDGRPFATYHCSRDLAKPFLHPVQTASGVVVNRALDDASDADHSQASNRTSSGA